MRAGCLRTDPRGLREGDSSPRGDRSVSWAPRAGIPLSVRPSVRLLVLSPPVSRGMATRCDCPTQIRSTVVILPHRPCRAPRPKWSECIRPGHLLATALRHTATFVSVSYRPCDRAEPSRAEPSRVTRMSTPQSPESTTTPITIRNADNQEILVQNSNQSFFT